MRRGTSQLDTLCMKIQTTTTTTTDKEIPIRKVKRPLPLEKTRDEKRAEIIAYKRELQENKKRMREEKTYQDHTSISSHDKNVCILWLNSSAKDPLSEWFPYPIWEGVWKKDKERSRELNVDRFEIMVSVNKNILKWVKDTLKEHGYENDWEDD